MIRRYLPLIALGIGAWLAFFVSAFPAATALRWFAPDFVLTSNVAGTLWSGSAQLASVADLAMRDLRWQIRPLPLLLARLRGSVEAALSSGFVNAEFSVSAGQTRLENVQLSTSLATFAQVMPISGTSGAVSARLDTLVIEDRCPMSASGNIRISNLLVEIMSFTSAGGQTVAIGSYEIVMSPSAEPGVFGTVSSVDGPIEVAARLALTPECQYSIEARVRERGSVPESLRLGLQAMASEPDPEGWRTLELAGSL
ncbi:MAG: type II secretion system protein N [Gammaproteobacteria bacterium]|jgi:hypothetical protein